MFDRVDVNPFDSTFSMSLGDTNQLAFTSPSAPPPVEFNVPNSIGADFNNTTVVPLSIEITDLTNAEPITRNVDFFVRSQQITGGNVLHQLTLQLDAAPVVFPFGSGNLVWNLAAGQALSSNGAPGSTFSDNTLTLNFDFLPVPLPAAGWLLLAALGALGAGARSRRP